MDRRTQLLTTWGATENQASRITAEIDDGLLEYIHESLLVAFNNPANQEKFMRMKNSNSPFNGTTPLEYLAKYPEQARQVAGHILALGMPW
ncbi:hypothetical protein LRP52_46695 [Photobacterium sp. ZSDE20]|nr:hypothetical protein [Photobacterium sp. ZSDE20]